MHMYMDYLSIATISGAFRQAVERNLKVEITELDIPVNNPFSPQYQAGDIRRALTPALALAQKKRYCEVIKAYMETVPPRLRGGVTVWGVSDPGSWLIADLFKNATPTGRCCLTAATGKSRPSAGWPMACRLKPARTIELRPRRYARHGVLARQGPILCIPIFRPQKVVLTAGFRASRACSGDRQHMLTDSCSWIIFSRMIDPRQMPSPDDPADALAAVVALRRYADALERKAVGAALRQGWTWSEIAQALGVSKQAAHKRLSGSVTDQDSDN